MATYSNGICRKARQHLVAFTFLSFPSCISSSSPHRSLRILYLASARYHTVTLTCIFSRTRCCTAHKYTRLLYLVIHTSCTVSHIRLLRRYFLGLFCTTSLLRFVCYILTCFHTTTLLHHSLSSFRTASALSAPAIESHSAHFHIWLLFTAKAPRLEAYSLPVPEASLFSSSRAVRIASTTLACIPGAHAITPLFSPSVRPSPKSSGSPYESDTMPPASVTITLPAAWS